MNTYFLSIKHEKGLKKRNRKNWVFQGLTRVDSRFTENVGKGKSTYLLSPTDIPILNAASVSIPVPLRNVHAYHPETFKLLEFNQKTNERANAKNLKAKV